MHTPPPDFVVLSNLDNLYPSISTSAFDTVEFNQLSDTAKTS